VTPQGSPEHIERPFAAGIPGQLRLVYFYGPDFPWDSPFYVKHIEPQAHYQAFFWDPRSGVEYPMGAVQPDEHGRWKIPVQPEMTDWLLVLTGAA
jgi:hypothetical protein